MNDTIQVTIAIVDDHALTRKTLSCRLASLGYNVVMEAENGKEFIDKIKGHPAPDICLLNFNMPGKGGLETAVRLKRDWPGIKILFFSMLKSDAYIDKLREIGIDGFISKNVPFAKLHDALLSIISRAGKKELGN